MRIAVLMDDQGYDFAPTLRYAAGHGHESQWLRSSEPGPTALIERLAGFDAVVAGGQVYDRGVLEALSGRLKIVARFGTGYDKVDLAAATELGIAVTNTPDAMTDAVAEHALGLMLCLARRTCHHDARLKSGAWETRTMGCQLAGKVFGIIGFGRIGGRLARYLSGFASRVLAHDLALDQAAAERAGVQPAALDEIAEHSDFVSIHLPQTPATRGCIGAPFLARMKPGAHLVNTSRGSVLVESDLIEALRKGRIAGAGLDVFEHEPLDASSPLRAMDNVVLTPHVASATTEAFAAAGMCAVDSILDLYAGVVPRNILNPGYVAAKGGGVR